MFPDYNGQQLNNVNLREADESGAVLSQYVMGGQVLNTVAFDGSGGVSLVGQTQVTIYSNMDAFAVGAIGDGQQVFISESATLQNDEFQLEFDSEFECKLILNESCFSVMATPMAEKL